MSMKIYRRIIILLLLITVVSQEKIIAQDTLAQWKVIDTGIETSYFCAAEDSSGNIWFGTEHDSGPVVYNGEEFIQYDYPTARTYSILTDRTGKIWFGTKQGLYIFDGTSFEQVDNEYIQPYTEIWDIVQDIDGSIWVGSVEGLRHFKDGEWKVYEGDNTWEGLADKIIYSLFVDSKGNKWIGVNSLYVGYTLVKYDNKEWKVFTEEEGAFKSTPNNFIEDSTGNIWIICWVYGIYMYDGNEIHSINPGISSYCGAVDKNGLLWFARRGILVYDSNSWIHFNLYNSDFIPVENIIFVFIDSKGNRWFCGRWWTGKLLFLSPGKVLSPEEVLEREKTEIVTEAGNIIVSPNPVNLSATVRYYVPERGKVSVGIYNILGQLVKSLVPETGQEIGLYAARWDGTGVTGQSVPSGVYFCCYRYGNKVKTAKFTVLK